MASNKDNKRSILLKIAKNAIVTLKKIIDVIIDGIETIEEDIKKYNKSGDSNTNSDNNSNKKLNESDDSDSEHKRL